MSLNINKRLRYFNTEAEYLAYVEAQRAAAEAGTLELMETTVCCIKHNDDTTPDEYHPSTEAGYTDVIFNYNENDDIRYVPFINPMWTARLCTLYPITDGYKPVLYQNAVLPDVIDGQQITYIDNDFTTHLLNRWPDFSTTNVTVLKFKSANGSTRLTLPSNWPNLTYVRIECGDTNVAGSGINIPIFGNTNTLDAPNLESFILTMSVYSGHPSYILSINNFPKITSDKLKVFTADFNYPQNNTELVTFDFDNVILNSSSLTTMNLNFYDSLNNDNVRVPSIKLTHDGPSLSISNIYLSHDTTDTTKGVTLNITTEANVVNCDNLVLCCDFNNSTCTCPLNIKKLTIRNCLSTASSSTTWGDYIVHSNGNIRVSFPEMYIFRNDCSEFNNTIIDLPEGIQIASGEYTVNFRTNTSGKTLTINMPNSSNYGFNFSTGFSSEGSSILDTLTINLPNTTPYYYIGGSSSSGGLYLRIPATNLVINGELWLDYHVVSGSRFILYDNYSVLSKTNLKLYGVGSVTSSTNRLIATLNGVKLKYFHPYFSGLILQLDSDVPSGVEATLCSSLQSVLESPSYNREGSLVIKATANTPSFSIETSDQNYTLRDIKLEIVNSTSSITLNTIKVILDEISRIYTVYQSAFQSSASEVRIHRVFYDQLPSNYITILNYFYTVNLIES